MKNGLLPVTLIDAEVAELMRRASETENYEVTVDLENKIVVDANGFSATFQIADFQRYCLLEGLDDVGLTLKYVAEIASYESRLPDWTPRIIS